MLSNNNLRAWVPVKEQTVTALIAAAKKAIPCADIVELKLGTLELGEIQRESGQ